MSESSYPGGKTTIAPEVLLTIARLSAISVPGVSRLSPIGAQKVNRLFKRGELSEGVEIDLIDDVVYADLYVVLEHAVNVREVSRNIQREGALAISEMVGMPVGRVNIHIEDIHYPETTAPGG